MLTIGFKTDLDRMERWVSDIQLRQLPFAAALALNETARTVRDRLNAEMADVFDRPTRFTSNAVVAPGRATKNDLVARVTVRPIQAQYLLLEDTGGDRAPGMNTRKSARALLGPGAINLDRYGNIPSGATARMSKAAADLAARRAANRGVPRAARVPTRSGIVYIKGGTPQAHGHPGGFFRLASNRLTRLEGFVGKASYKPRLHFVQRAEAIARATFNLALLRALARATRRA